LKVEAGAPEMWLMWLVWLVWLVCLGGKYFLSWTGLKPD
jgi:hypothetical protein